MKKIFTHLFALFLLSFVSSGAWAQDANAGTRELSLEFGSGTCNTTTGTYCSSWVSNTEPAVTLSVADGKNNLVVSPSSESFELHEGSGGSNWNLSAGGYVILSYSFTYKTKVSGNNVTITANGTTYTSSDVEQELKVTGLSSSVVSFNLNGNNKGIIVTDFKLEVRQPLALASLEVGQVYRFENVEYTGFSLNANSATDVNCVATSETDTKQQWYVAAKDGEYYVLRNLAYGKFLKGNGQSSAWGMSDDYSHDYNKFKLYTSNTDYNTLHTNTLANYAYMHSNSSKNIVGWSNNAGDDGSHWEVVKVDYTAGEIAALLEKAPTTAEIAAYPAALEAIFSDAACTVLNANYTAASMNDEALESDENYSALPQALKNMVKKVRSGVWTEKTVDPAERPNGNNNTNLPDDMWEANDTWEHEYAKKFRVQMYEPYSVEGEITTFLGINAHCNMDNPTGIYANAGELIYIMVDGDIAEGAELWVAHKTGHGVTEYYNNAAYTELKKGLNVIPYSNDGSQLWINYVVHTYNTSTGEFPHKLGDYKPLKIHIEGGHINGFFNAMGDFRANDSGTEDLWGEVDNDADWDYYKARVALADDFALLGHRQTLLFPFGTWNSTNGYFGVANDAGGIEKALAYWLENIEVPATPNCYGGSGNTFGDYSDTYYPGMNLVTGGTPNKINIMLEAWDRIMYSEHATMGLLGKSDIDKMNSLYPGWTAQNTTFDIYNYGSNDTGDTYKAFCEGRDYSDYYNHHGAAVGSNTGYMSGGWRVCNYHYNTMGSIIGKIAKEAGPTWGPAHEIGHQHQKIFNLNGQTEVTNNFFSNVAVWYMGMGTSRVNGNDGSLNNLLSLFNNEDENQYLQLTQGGNIWALTHLYYRLWLYYHLANNNTQFWPRLFELCRQTPLENGTQISGETSLLRFYQHACDAAGEDLTEFFRAHGYFDVMDNVYVGDYTNATYNMTEEQIETAISEVKEKKYPVNYAVLLINDATSETTLQHDGTTKRALWDTNASAEYGSVNDFIDGNTSVTEAYTATLNSDGSITMSGGEGGVGFLVFNEKGELVSFSNKSTFELSDEAKKTILSGNATFVAVDSKNNVTTAAFDLTAMQKEILGELIAEAQPIIDKIDGTYTKIGFYKGAAVADLASALEYAQKVYESSSGYGEAYDLLYAELKKVEANPDAKIPFDSSLTYIITNRANPALTMYLNDSKVVKTGTSVTTTDATARWQFKETGAPGVYNVYNTSGYYCPAISQSNTMTATETAGATALYTLQEMEDGVWAIRLSPASGYKNFHSDGSNNVVGWEIGSNSTRWYLTAVAPNATIANLTNLEVYINKTEALLGEVLGEVTYTRGDNITLQTTTEGSAGYIWSNAPCPTEGDIANLVDGATNNYFHTAWEDVTVSSGDHYIAVDLGEDNTLTRFAFSHTTRSADNDHVKSVDVYGSDDNVTYKYLGSASGMPQTRDTFWQYEGVMIASHRYLRFNMHANRGYWHMAEFDIMPVTGFTATVNDTYSGTVTVAAVTAAMEALLSGKSVALSMSPTKDGIDDALATLRDKYEALYELYELTIIKRKETLAQLASETDELILKAGTVTLATETPFELTTSNLYCNEVRADDCGTGGDTSANGYVSNLTDNNTSTFLHTNYNNATAVNPPHYLRVDFGDGSTVTKFKFSYTTRDNGNNCPTTIVIEGCDTEDGTYDEIKTLTTANGLPNGSALEFNSSVIPMDKAYRYVRFKVTGVEGGDATFFVMSEFSLATVTSATADVLEVYEDYISDDMLLSSKLVTNSSTAMSTNELVTSVPLLDAQIADQQAVKDKLYAAMNNTAAHKENLKKLIDDTQALYGKMATDDGAVNEYYSTSVLTADNLSGALAMITAAQTVYDNSSATVDAINAAYYDLNEKYTILKGIEDLDVTDRGDLNNLIATMQSLLEQTTVNGAVETGNVALQVADKTAPFYIWNYKPATDDDGIAALIDETDGVANTGTFTGTYWQAGNVDPYTHYLEIDLGVNNVLEDLSIDYTTRNSTHANQRPNGLKFLGSNNKVDYEEFHSVISGLTTDANTKWSMETPVEPAKNYRYVRIAVSTEAGYFNMSDFNLYSSSIATVNEFYSTSDIFGCLPAVLRGYSDAKKAVAVYLLSDDYTNAKEALQLQIDALQAIIDGNVDDRTELKTLADETEPLVTEVAAFDETETELEMQCDDPSAPYYLYCNADGTKTNGSGDNVGVAALVGENKDNTTHLHTTYGNNAQDDDLDHYLRLDMGEDEAIMSFKFSYTGRSTNSNNDPSEMIIQGCNTLDGDWEEIVSLTNLPTDGDGVVYNSDKIESDKAFRYIRFMVTATQNGAVNNGHPFFVLSKFSVTACKTIEVKTEYVSPNLPLSTLVTANNEVVEASAMVDDTEHYVTETAYSTAKNELQAARDALELAKNLKELPVVLTTDASNPVLYKIRINRSNTTLLQYDHASTMVAVADDNLGNEYQAWYFMQGKDDSGYDDVMIYPYWGADAANTSLRLGSNDISNGDSKVKAVDGSDNAYKTNWYITFTEGSTAANWWNIQPEGKATYFSNHGGVSKKMGFLNDADDDGSEFQFILDETDYSLSDAYYALYNLYNSYGGTKVAGTAIGCYISVDAYNSAYNAAATLIENKNATDEEYIDARTALEAAYAALERRMPVEGGFYRLKSAYTGRYSDGKYIYADAENKLYFSDASDVLSKYIWQFEEVDGGYYVKNLHTDSYIKTAGWGAQIELSSTAGKVTIETLDDELGILRINTTAHPLHAQESGSKVVGYSGGLNSASAWYIEEVENVEEAFKHTETLSALGYGTLILNYDAKVPDGVTAYVADGVNGFDIIMTPVDNDIIPANTAVILQKENIDGNALDMQFKYSTAASGSYDSNMLRGTLYTKVVKCDTDDVNNNIYMMQNKNGAVKMYWMYENYNAEGERVQIDGSYNHDEGGYVRCTANRAYLVVPQNTAQGAAAYSFRFTGPTTGIDEVNADSGAEKVIYDLQGRKLSEITEPGIYIVNGKKIYVK